MVTTPERNNITQERFTSDDDFTGFESTPVMKMLGDQPGVGAALFPTARVCARERPHPGDSRSR